MNKLLFSVMLFGLSFSVTAGAAVTYELGESSNTVTIKSDISADETFMYLLTPDNDMESLKDALENGNENSVLAYFEQIKDNSEEFTRVVKMKSDLLPGEYTLFLNGEQKSVWYAPAQYRFDTCEEIGMVNEDCKDLLTQNIFYFAKEPSRIVGSENIAKIVDSVKNRLTPGSLKADAESCKKLSQLIEEALLYVKTSNGDMLSENELEELIEKSFTADIFTLLGKVSDEGIANIISKLSQSKVSDYDAFKNTVNSYVVLSAIGYPVSYDSAEIAKVIMDYSGYINLDTKIFRSFPESKRMAVAQKISNAKPESAEEIEKIIRDNNIVQSTSGGSNSGGGGGGGGISPVPSTPAKTETAEPTAPTTDTPQGNTVNFKDIENYGWAAEAIAFMVQNKYVNGVSENEFAPERNITRAEFVAVISRCMKYSVSENSGMVFTDVPKDSWAYEPVVSAYEKGIVSGVGEGLFNPEANITRQDMAVILHNIYKESATDVDSDNSFTDWNEIADYAAEAVGVLHGAGILNGSENHFNPLGLCTRAEAVQAVYNFMRTMNIE